MISLGKSMDKIKEAGGNRLSGARYTQCNFVSKEPIWEENSYLLGVQLAHELYDQFPEQHDSAESLDDRSPHRS